MMTWRDDGSRIPGRMRWRCPDCGTGVASDEDGCCVTCGATCAAEPDDGAPPLPDDDLAVRQAAIETHGLRAGQRMFHSAAMAAEDVVEAAMDGDDARAARRLEDARRFGRVASALAGAPLDAGGRCRVCGCTDPEPCSDVVSGDACAWAEPDLCDACAQRPQTVDGGVE